MKALLAICMLVTATFVWAGETPVANPPAGVVKGEVLEVQNVANFTYVRLKTDDGEIWAAVINTPIKKGAVVTIENAIVMKNFESKTLKKTFPMILFGSLGGSGANAANAPAMSGAAMGGSAMGGSAMGGAAMGGAAMGGAATGGAGMNGHALGTAYATIPNKKLDTINDAPVPKAKGANARTVAEIIRKATSLKDKPVLVRGKVVKYNEGIMGKNWIHLRDGSGSEADNTNDILVTTVNGAMLGDIVTVKGIVHNDKDFGAGYAYKVLIEEATLQK